jgi:carbon-monoxide dehydrogenase medium subunit
MITARVTAVIAGPNGRREAPVEAIVTGPGQTSLGKGEFIVEFRIPKPRPKQCDAYLRFTPRTEMDIAVVGCAVNVTLDASGLCTDARVSLGAVAPTQLIVDEAAQTLIGHRLDDETLSKLDAAAGRVCKPINDKRGTIEYRIKVAGVLARRAAAIAFERAGVR